MQEQTTSEACGGVAARTSGSNSGIATACVIVEAKRNPPRGR